MKTFPPTSRTKADGFTLIELLIVMLIIMVLLALLMPTLSSVRDSAWKTVAKNQCVQIATAITAYETEYGRLPAFSGTNLSTNNLRMLLGNLNDTNNNPRGIVLIDASAWKLGKGGTNTNGFCDPFSSNTVYAVALDTNYSNLITNTPYQTNTGGTVLYTTSNNPLTKHVAVWTIWTKGKQTNLINSWD